MATGESLNPPAPSDAFSADAFRTSSLYNDDLAPVTAERRTWGTYNYAALWVAMSVNIPTYLLASGMIAGGMDWKQAIFTVFLGNVLVLIPMLLNAHAGARYGIPFPVFARASFGVLGANVPALLRALVACGWFGIQTWIGGQAINAMLVALDPRWSEVRWGVPLCFAAFWLLHVMVIARGIRTIRWLQGVTAPFLLAIGVALLVWAVVKAGGFGPMLAAPSKFRSLGEFFRFFVPSLNRSSRLLGHRGTEHSRLHALRAQPEGASVGASAGFAGYDDVLFLYRHRGDVRNRADIRAGDLGPGSRAGAAG